MPPRRLIVLAFAAALVGPPAGGQEEGEPLPALDLRPPAAAYTVLDGARIPAPLGGLAGDPGRGAALFADLETGGCVACHDAPGLPRVEASPRILRDRLPELPPPPAPAEEAPDGEDEDPQEAEVASDSDSPLAPVSVALLPRPRPAQEAEADPAEPVAEAEPAPPDPPRPPLLPLQPGPSLEGVAGRLSEGRLRLWVVNPRVADAEARMPAYHDVSAALAQRNPELRQPWLSPQQVEDVVAYLLTLGPAGPAEEE